MPKLTVPALKHVPELDPGFVPASLWNQAFRDNCSDGNSREIRIAIFRPDGTGTIHTERILRNEDDESAILNFRLIERVVKFLLWSFGGTKVILEDAPSLAQALSDHYCEGGKRHFDADYSRRFFGKTLTFSSESTETFSIPRVTQKSESQIGLKGNRIGFDLGGSDRKCAAVINGEVVFSEEVTWDPYFQSDPAYHREGIIDSIRLAAAHLPKVDAIGGSAAGVYVDSKVRAASLFRGVPNELFSEHVENIFFEVAEEWNVPIRVVNDGDVTALAGAMSLNAGCVLGLAMGTSADCPGSLAKYYCSRSVCQHLPAKEKSLPRLAKA